MSETTDPTNRALFVAFWEDRGSQLADEYNNRKIILTEHSQLAMLAVDELGKLNTSWRGPAIEAMLRGYRERISKIEAGQT